MTEDCPECEGRKQVKVKATSSGGTVTIKCPTCNGTGRKPNPKSGSKSRHFL